MRSSRESYAIGVAVSCLNHYYHGRVCYFSTDQESPSRTGAIPSVGAPFNACVVLIHASIGASLICTRIYTSNSSVVA